MDKSPEISPDKFLKISWGAIVFLISVTLGFGAWMTSQELKAQSNSEEIVKIHAQADQVQDMLNSIDKRLSHIEFLLEDNNKGE